MGIRMYSNGLQPGLKARSRLRSYTSTRRNIDLGMKALSLLNKVEILWIVLSSNPS